MRLFAAFASFFSRRVASLRVSAGLRSIRHLRRVGVRSSRAVKVVPCASCAPECLRYARCRPAARSREARSALSGAVRYRSSFGVALQSRSIQAGAA